VEVWFRTGKWEGGEERGGDEGKLQFILFVAVILISLL